jgi:hypothetical protein
MVWIIGCSVVLVVIAVGAWILGPTIGTFRGPAFEPASKDPASIEKAQQSGNSAGAGGGGA